MIKPELKEEAIRLLQEGKLSKNKIIKKVGISRKTLYKIANELKEQKQYKRCPGCGGMQEVGLQCMDTACDLFIESKKKREVAEYNSFMESLLGKISYD